MTHNESIGNDRENVRRIHAAAAKLLMNPLLSIDDKTLALAWMAHDIPATVINALYTAMHLNGKHDELGCPEQCPWV